MIVRINIFILILFCLFVCLSKTHTIDREKTQRFWQQVLNVCFLKTKQNSKCYYGYNLKNDEDDDRDANVDLLLCVCVCQDTFDDNWVIVQKKSDEQPKKSILLSILLDLIPLYYCSFVHLHTN